MTDGDTQGVLLFRLSICVLLMGLEVLACLAGKLVKERSEFGFGYFYSFCGGILLSKGIFCGLFDSIRTDGSKSLGYSLSLFSLSFVALTACSMAIKSGAYGYNVISAMDDSELDDEERLGIELGMLPQADDDDDDGSDDNSDGNGAVYDRAEFGGRTHGKGKGPVRHVSATNQLVESPDALRERSEALLWSYCVLSVTILAECASGLMLGSTEHEALSSYSKIFWQGILLSLVCGAILEDSVRSPVEYVRAIAALVLSLPSGLIGGGFLVHWLGLTLHQLAAFSATVYPVAAGCYTAAAVLHMVSVTSAAAQDASGGYQSKTARVLQPGRLRALCFILGYALTSASAQLS